MSKVNYRYLPFVVYSLLLAALWVASWFIGVIGLFSHSGREFRSLFSGEGVRWALYTAIQSIDAAPWGEIMLVVASAGVLVASGLFITLVDMALFRSLSAIRRYAAGLTLAVLLLFSLLLFATSVAPWHLLAGVTDEWSTSAIVMGWLLIVFSLSLAVSLMHGSLCGYYRSVSDVVQGMSALFPMLAPAFLAVLPASGIMPCLEYIGLLDIGNSQMLSNVLCWLPFIYIGAVESVSAIKRIYRG